jgi:hypothetical protein
MKRKKTRPRAALLLLEQHDSLVDRDVDRDSDKQSGINIATACKQG